VLRTGARNIVTNATNVSNRTQLETWSCRYTKYEQGFNSLGDKFSPPQTLDRTKVPVLFFVQDNGTLMAVIAAICFGGGAKGI
jgi:hypothetical protein